MSSQRTQVLSTYLLGYPWCSCQPRAGNYMLTVVPGTISRGVREISSYENEKSSSEAPLIDFPLISHWPELGHMSMP